MGSAASDVPIGADGRARCFGTAPGQELYAKYHDTEWGVPVRDDQTLFEFLVLEGAQAGLSWWTVLKKRAAYREAFYDFDPAHVATMTDEQLDTLCRDARLIRNRLKIYSARQNAQVFLKLQKELGSFSTYLWAYVDNEPIKNNFKTLDDVPASTPLSEQISKNLGQRGMTFVGPTIVYAYLQAVGVVDDHVTGCWKRGLSQ